MADRSSYYCADDDNGLSDNDDLRPYYVWWLIPAEPFKSKLQALIDRLAGDNSVVSFEPHITVSRSGPVIHPPIQEVADWTKDDHETAIIKIPKSNLRVATGNKFTQSVLLKFTDAEDDDDDDSSTSRHYNNAGLWNLRDHLADDPIMDADTSDTAMFPHLSLLYKDCSMEEKEIIAEGIDLAAMLRDEDDLLCFDAIQCMQIYLPVRSPKDVRRWSKVGETLYFP